MRAVGHFLIFVAFFLVFAALLGLLILGAATLRSSLVLLILVPALSGLYLLYARGFRQLVGRSGAESRSAG